jgi:O-antigen/teichoic acid export membrane protein
VLVSRLSWYAYANSDFVVAGRVLGQVELGAYAVAWNLASTSIDKLTDLLARVGPTFVSEAQHDTASLRRYVRHLTRGISLITFPVTLGLAAVAPDFVLVVLGSRWATAVAPLQLLALYGCLRSITTLFGPIMSAVDVRWASRYSLVFPLVFPTAFYVGSRWGTVGIAAGWVCLYPLLYIPIYRRLLRRLEMPLREYLRTLWPALSGSVAMLVVVGAIRQFAPSDWPRAESLAVQVCAGAMTYLGAVAVAHRDDYAIVRQLVRSVRS